MAKGPYDASQGKLPPKEPDREDLTLDGYPYEPSGDEPSGVPQKKAASIGLDLSKLKVQFLNLNARFAKLERAALAIPNLAAKAIELQSKLKETIRAVERLAGGKSLGNLGLPTEESWNQPS